MLQLEGSLSLFAGVSAASSVMQAYVTPAVLTLCGLASLACTFFLVYGGMIYMSSTGKPEKLEQAKKIFKNALIGLVLVIGAGTLTAILNNAYTAAGSTPVEQLPTLNPIKPKPPESGLVDVLINAVVGLLSNIVQSVGEPFLQALSYFINSTPLMGDNASVFNIWLAIVGMTDVLFIIVVALLGFHVMSFSVFGFDEIDIKHLLPQIGLIFLLINTSIFAIDAVIGLSNIMIRAIQSGFPSTDIWLVLANITKKSSDIGLAGLLVMTAFLILTVILLIYYVGRLIILYLGAILSPLILLIWLLPAFKDFATTAFKTYLTTIFVLFVHVIILLLAASIFTGISADEHTSQPNALMAMIVGLATIIALLKTQGVMSELSYAASAPRAARELSGSFMRGVGYMRTGSRMAKQGYKTGGKVMKASKRLSGKRTSHPAGPLVTRIPENRPTVIQMRDVPPLKTGETRKAPKSERS